MRHQKTIFGALTLLEFIPEGAEPKRETAQLRGVVEWEVSLVPCPGNLGLVLDANHVGGHPYPKSLSLSLLFCHFSERLRGHVLGERTCRSETSDRT